ncbi:MAG: LD-carboxypeptidase [Bacteroidales bacterium]|nr:LD-carboxypeptidase [Bacteroidales bacterium]
MITPPYLKSGDTVGIVAPSRSIDNVSIEKFTYQLGEWGLNWKFGDNLFGQYNRFSGKDEERGDDLQNMINDPEIRAIFAARGGYGSIRTLQNADFSNFEKDPKWLIGYSDITVLHSYINKFTGTESIHGPMPLNFRETPDKESVESLRKALFGESLGYKFEGHELNIEGEADGEIVGGNLALISSLNGTVLFPDLRNKILFIEDVDEYLYNIDRMMMNLSLSGVFNRIKALVVGDIGIKKEEDDIPFGKTAQEIIHEITDQYNIPVCFNFPAGHVFKNKTLIFGRKIQLRVEENKSSLVFNT